MNTYPTEPDPQIPPFGGHPDPGPHPQPSDPAAPLPPVR